MKVREIVLCALFIALVAVGAFIRIPVGTDVYTLQFLFTLLAGVLLGARLGAVAVGVYVLMGLVGIPVFASGGGISGIRAGSYVYFVHSYHAVPEEPQIITAQAMYGECLTAAVAKDNVQAVQFHPEKSGAVGSAILKNFVNA